MVNGVFSNISGQTNLLAQTHDSIKKENNKKINDQQQVITTVKNEPVVDTKTKIKNAVKKAAPVVIPLAAIPVTALVTYKLSTKNVKDLQKQLSEIKDQIKNSNGLCEDIQNQVKAVNSAKKGIYGAVAAVVGLTGINLGSQITENEENMLIDQLKSKAAEKDAKIEKSYEMSSRAMSASKDALAEKYTDDWNGIKLLYNKDSKNRNDKKLESALKKVNETATKYLQEAPSLKAITHENPTIWSVTSELEPIKEGGLGKVPLEVATNAQKVGVDIPTFIPMYMQNGVSSFTKEGDKTYYSYGNAKYELTKVASFEVDAFNAGKSSSEKVELYSARDAKNNQVVFIKNDSYFNGSIYESNQKSEEPEKFAFFSKVVYEFAKVKSVDDENKKIIEHNNSLSDDNKDKKKQLANSPVKCLEIENREAFDAIKSPDAMILNDWQAAPYAALARYKAPLENAYSQISDSVADRLSTMNIITIGHNTMYQGNTQNGYSEEERLETTSDILNTLFDNYTFDIVKNAHSGASKTNPNDNGLKKIDNVLVFNPEDRNENHTNLLNMGVCLSNYFCPVSQNFACEIIAEDTKELSGEVRWALVQKNNNGSLYGIINGNDFKNVALDSKIKNIKDNIGLDFKSYTRESSIDEIMNARFENKKSFYNDFIVPFTNKNDENNKSDEVNFVREKTQKLEYIAENDMPLNKMSDDELRETPIISLVARLVDQKGSDIYSDAIKDVFNDWEQIFPGKRKPIFYIGGTDGEEGRQKDYIKKVKSEMKKEDSSRLIFAHGFANTSAFAAASDFFSLPSKFEPCGLTQGESLGVATPVIASAVGGIVDTVNRNGKFNGILTEKGKKPNKDELKKAIVDALRIYYENPEQYKNMVKDAYAEDFSWLQKGKQGPEYEYFEKLGISKDNLNDVA